MSRQSRAASGVVRPRTLPEIGARIPGFVPRVALGIVIALLSIECFTPGFWLVVGIGLTVLAVVVPRRLTAWVLLFLLGASQAFHDPSMDWHFFMLLAGLHLVHILASLTLTLPVRGWVQLAVFRPLLLRFLAIQIPVQGMGVLALVLLQPGTNGGQAIALPAFAIIGAVALVAVTLLLIVPLLRERAR